MVMISLALELMFKKKKSFFFLFSYSFSFCFPFNVSGACSIFLLPPTWWKNMGHDHGLTIQIILLSPILLLTSCLITFVVSLVIHKQIINTRISLPQHFLCFLCSLICDYNNLVGQSWILFLIKVYINRF